MALATTPAIVRPKKIVELGELTVDYDETIAAKIAWNGDPKRIAWNTPLATDENFPDKNTGKIVYDASAWHFGVWMPKDVLKASVEAEGKILGTPKPLIDSAIRNPRPKLDNIMPLVAAGQEFVGARRHRYALYLDRHGGKRYLDFVLLDSDEEWVDRWLFLVLAGARPLRA
ncbi:MAG: hypothetical protein AAB665_03390 [Patescibacteria group bacterium]